MHNVMQAEGRELDQIAAHGREMVEPIIVVFACPTCNLAYQAKQLHRANEALGEFICIKCKGRVHSWKGVYDYVAWKPIKT